MRNRAEVFRHLLYDVVRETQKSLRKIAAKTFRFIVLAVVFLDRSLIRFLSISIATMNTNANTELAKDYISKRRIPQLFEVKTS